MRHGTMAAVVAFALFQAGVCVGQQLQPISGAIAERLNAGSAERRIAVVDFVDLQGVPTELGRYLAEELSISLAGSAKRFLVIDRSHLQALLQEHKLSASGLVDPQTARKLGELAGADTLLTGTVTPFGDTVRVAVKAIDVRTAALITATATDLPRTKAVEELLSRVTSSGTSRSSSSSASAQAPASADEQSASTDGFAVTLQSCQRGGGTVGDARSRRGAVHLALVELGQAPGRIGGQRAGGGGDTVVCRLIVVNQRDDRHLFISGTATRAFDESGEEFHTSAILIARESTRSKMLIAGVRTPVTLSFEAVPKSSTRFSVVEFGLGTIGGGGLKFRNVAIR